MSDTDLVLAVGRRTVTASLVGPSEGWPVLFFHGSPGCRWQARRLEAAAASQGARLIALDRPGCGRTSPAVADWPATMVEDVRLVLDHLQLGSVSALAVSGGAGAALRTATRLGERLDRLVIASGLGLLASKDLVSDASWSNRAMVMASRRGPDAARVALVLPALASRLMPARVLPAGGPQDLRGLHAEVRETFAQGTRGPAEDIHDASRIDQLDVSAVTQQVVAWHGSDDHYAPLPAIRALVERLPNASLRVVEDGDHFVFVSHAEEMLADLAPPS